MSKMLTDYDEFLQDLERKSMLSRGRVRDMLIESDRPDLVAEYDQNMKEIDNGVKSAQSAWHSISPAQRRVLSILADGYELRWAPSNKNKYEGYCAARKRDAIGYICQIKTVRALCARELAHVNGGAFDPEKSIVVTEHGKFVVKFGTPHPKECSLGEIG